MLKKENLEKSENNELQLFVQGEGIADIQLVRIHEHLTLRDLHGNLSAVFTEIIVSATEVDEFIFLLEDSEQELPFDKPIKEIGIKHCERIHIHRCRKIKVSVNFNGREAAEAFPPSKTIAKVKRWADKEFGIEGVDATEHALQICGTAKRPDEDVHIGALVRRPNCQVCFDLVPKKRVEGEF
jgi:hypothetical protein